jgi:hypothetical protein
MFKSRDNKALKRIFSLSIICILLAIMSATSICSAADENVMVEYAPIFYFEGEETCYPVTAQYHLDNSENKTNDDLGITYYDNLIGTVKDNNIINDYQSKESTLGYTVYYRVDESSGKTVIQYWMFYAFNKGDLNQHEGDWELVQIVINNNEPESVMYSQHHSGQQATWSQVEKTNNNFHVYVARGSHANYLRSYSGVLGIASDHVGSNGKILRPTNYQLISLSDQDWLEFVGRWGEVNNLKDLALGRAGPNGPMYREEGNMWNTPINWGANLPMADVNIFFAEMVLYNFVLIFTLITILSVGLLLYRLYKNKDTVGIGSRIFSFLYIDGGNLKSIGNILFIVGFIVAIIALFYPWYAMSAAVDSQEFTTDGMTNFLLIDGLNGIQISLPGSNGPVPLGSLFLPFSVFIAIGLIFTLIRTIGIKESNKLGGKYLFKGIRLIIPVILIIIGIVAISMIVSNSVPAEAESSMMPVLDSLSSAPLGGSSSIQISEGGLTSQIDMNWGLGFGAYLLIFSAIIIIIAGICEKIANTNLFDKE